MEMMLEVKKGRPQSRFLLEVFHKDCSARMLEISEVPVFDAQNELTVIEGIAHDITEKHNAEELIREQEEKYRQVFNSASDFIFLFNLQKDNSPGKFIEVNNYTQRVMGYTQQELLQMTPDDLMLPRYGMVHTIVIVSTNTSGSGNRKTAISLMSKSASTCLK